LKKFNEFTKFAFTVESSFHMYGQSLMYAFILYKSIMKKKLFETTYQNLNSAESSTIPYMPHKCVHLLNKTRLKLSY